MLFRVCDIQDIQNCTLWWNGPSWLTYEQVSWKTLYQIHKAMDTICEERKQSNTVVMVAEVTKNNYFVRLCKKYSKINRFQRVFAYELWVKVCT